VQDKARIRDLGEASLVFFRSLLLLGSGLWLPTELWNDGMPWNWGQGVRLDRQAE
jgi:hypothetical protein